MEFRETLLAAQRNQQQKSSDNSYYKARFDPPKKEQKQRDRLSANIQKFLQKKDDEEKQKKLEAQRKREELIAMRDPKALRKIQKTLKVIKSANKSVLADAIDRDNTAVTLTGPEQPDQDDYGYESQEAAAIYEKMMEKYSKIPDQPKFSKGGHGVKKDLNGTRERVKHALQHENDPVPHKRRRKGESGERDQSPPTKYEPEKRDDKQSKPEKPKFRKPAPPPMDFNQLLKLAEQKKSVPVEVAKKPPVVESENERLMTKKQKRDYEEEMLRRQRRQERIDAEKTGIKKSQRDDKLPEKERRQEPSSFGRIPKLSNKTADRNRSPNPEKDKLDKLQKEKDKPRTDREKNEREKERLDRERLDRLKAEREKIDRDIDRLNKDRERLEKTKLKLESKSLDKSSKIDKVIDRSKLNSTENMKKNIDLKSQNTYRIDKIVNEKKLQIQGKNMNGLTSHGKPVPNSNKEQTLQKGMMKDKNASMKQKVPENGKRLSDSKDIGLKKQDDRRPATESKSQAGSSKPKITNSFDFNKHVSSLGRNNYLGKNGVKKAEGGRQFPPGDVRRKPQPNDVKKKPKRPTLHSDSEYDSEMDDFIDDGDENMDYSSHIKEIFGYDKSKYRDIDDDDDPMMESSFAVQQREEYISKKIGIMEDLEDMRMEAMEKKKSKKSRRISDD